MNIKNWNEFVQKLCEVQHKSESQLFDNKDFKFFTKRFGKDFRDYLEVAYKGLILSYGTNEKEWPINFLEYYCLPESFFNKIKMS